MYGSLPVIFLGIILLLNIYVVVYYPTRKREFLSPDPFAEIFYISSLTHEALLSIS